jgi:hypothetical protein
MGLVITACFGWLVAIVKARQDIAAIAQKRKLAAEQLEIMKTNAAEAVKAVDQMEIYKNLPNPDKARAALRLASQLNAVAGILPLSEPQVVLNEASVKDQHNPPAPAVAAQTIIGEG